MKRPNVLFVFPDQLGAAWTGTYGNSDVSTPHLDDFASQGILFRQAYTNVPLCTPYRGTLFTGRYQHQTGVSENGLRIPNGETTIADLFNQGGYHTSYVGKWHLSGPPHGNRWIPPGERAGFQDFVGWESHHVDHWKGLAFEKENNPIELKGHETDGLTDIVCKRLEQLKDSDQPFCLFTAYQSPHHPCSPPQEYLEMYRNKVYTDRPNVHSDAIYHNHYKNDDYGENLSLDQFRETYFGEITQMDAAFGRILDRLKELKLDENTIVIFTSDHGDMVGAHGLYEKSVVYEEAVRVPLVVRVPEGPQGVSIDSLFSTVDFLPTLLELCSLPSHEGAEGISYAQAMRGEKQTEVRESVFISHYEAHQTAPKVHCIRKGAYKLTTDIECKDKLSLYQLDDDPYELNDLLNLSGYEEIGNDLHLELKEWLKDTHSRIGLPHEASEMSPWFKNKK